MHYGVMSYVATILDINWAQKKQETITYIDTYRTIIHKDAK